MKSKLFLILFVLLAVASLKAQEAIQPYQEKVTSAANACATISNLGLIGNAFGGSFNVLGYPSCEFPCGSGIEHIFEGGLWVGGILNGTELVSTGAVDAASGYSTGRSGFEFSPITALTERSTLANSPYYNPSAISHQDFVATFTDKFTSIPTSGGNSIPIIDHLSPLNVKVDFQAYNWNYSFANFFIVLNFRVTNNSTQPIDSVWLGYWVDGVVRNVNLTPPGGSAFFNKSGNGYIDSLNMGYEFDAAGDIGYTESYVATKFLGMEKNGAYILNPTVTYNTWQFQSAADPIFFFPQTDKQRYDKMRLGLNQRADWDQLQAQINAANNRSNLVAAGKIDQLAPGEYVDIAYAIVLAKKVEDGNPTAANTPAQKANLIKNAQWAQTAYFGEDANRNGILDPGEDKDGNGKITRFVLPAPPALPGMKIVASDKKIEVYWAKNAENSIDPISNKKDFEGYRLYKTAVGFDVQNTTDILNSLKLVGEWDAKGNGIGFETGFNAVQLAQAQTFEGDTTKYYYKYTFENILNGWQHIVALTAFDQGDPVNNLESLESAPLANLKHVFAGKPANTDMKANEPFVYPNPYYLTAPWEGISQYEEDRKLMFANLPRHAEVRIYTVSGDLIDVFEHKGMGYNLVKNENGEEIAADPKWFDTYSNRNNAVFSGGEHAWDLLSKDSQAISRGLYLFTVQDLESGKVFRGKFVVVK